MVYEQPDKASTLVEQLEEALHTHDVHDGFPRERIALATNLANHGFVVADIDLLAASILAAQKKRGSIGPILCAALKEPREAAERVQDIRKGVARKKRKDKPEPGRSERQVGTMSSGQFSNVDENQYRRMAYAIVVADRKQPGVAAREIGVSVDQINQWVKTEVAIREKDYPPKRVKGKDDNETPEQRLARFREMMAEKRSKET